MNFNLYTISYGGEARAKVATTPLFFKEAIIVTKDSDVEIYKKHFPENKVVSFPDDCFGRNHNIPNLIRKKFGEDIICLIDDDLKRVVIFRTMEPVDDADFAYGKICDIAQIMADLSLPYATTSNDMRPYGRDNICFRPISTCGGIRFYNFLVGDEEDFKNNDDEFGMFADTEAEIRMLVKYRCILGFNHIVFHFDLQGKNTTNSYSADIERCWTNMKLKYGKYFDYNPHKKTTTIRLKR